MEDVYFGFSGGMSRKRYIILSCCVDILLFCFVLFMNACTSSYFAFYLYCVAMIMLSLSRTVSLQSCALSIRQYADVIYVASLLACQLALGSPSCSLCMPSFTIHMSSRIQHHRLC